MERVPTDVVVDRLSADELSRLASYVRLLVLLTERSTPTPQGPAHPSGTGVVGAA
jgi:hypothetical protein